MLSLPPLCDSRRDLQASEATPRVPFVPHLLSWLLFAPYRARMLVECEFFFFFVCSYSHATLLDHGGVLVNHFFPSAVPPRRAGSVTATRALRPGPSPYPLPCLHQELNPGCPCIAPPFRTGHADAVVDMYLIAPYIPRYLPLLPHTHPLPLLG